VTKVLPVFYEFSTASSADCRQIRLPSSLLFGSAGTLSLIGGVYFDRSSISEI
jgi:hypothetical protein